MSTYIIKIAQGFGDRDNINGTIDNLSKNIEKPEIIAVELDGKILIKDLLEQSISYITKQDKVIIFGAGPVALEHLSIIKSLVQKKTDKVKLMHISHSIFNEQVQDYDVFEKGDILFSQETDFTRGSNGELIKKLKNKGVDVNGNFGVGHSLTKDEISHNVGLFEAYLTKNCLLTVGELNRPHVFLCVGGETINGKIKPKEIDAMFDVIKDLEHHNIIITGAPRTSKEISEYIQEKTEEYEKMNRINFIRFFPFWVFGKDGEKDLIKYQINNKLLIIYIETMGLINKYGGFAVVHSDSTTMVSVLGSFVKDVRIIKTENSEECNKKLAEEYLTAVKNNSTSKFISKINSVIDRQSKKLGQLLISS